MTGRLPHSVSHARCPRLSQSPPTRNVLTPSQVNSLARSLLEDSFPQIWLEGELGNLSRPASGHIYFTLKDANAQIRCALFKSHGMRLPFRPEPGQMVLVRGRISLYEARGDYQLIADQMEPAGDGALRRAMELLKQKLAAEGLFESATKRPLPRFPRRLALLTSPSGAAVRDVLQVLARRFPLTGVEVIAVPVQGEGAAARIIAALERVYAAGRHDLIVLTRGGGSLEDLWAFNDEALVRALARSPVPTVSAIGHEIDTSLTDLVADVRAATPSVAAELIVPDQRALLRELSHRRQTLARYWQRRQREQIQRLDQVWLRLTAQQPQRQLQRAGTRAEQARERLASATAASLGLRRQKMANLRRLLHGLQPARQLERLARALPPLAVRQRNALRSRLSHERQRCNGLGQALAMVSPLATLDRGYAIVQRAGDGAVVRRADQVQTGEVVHARLADGRLKLGVLDPD